MDFSRDKSFPFVLRAPTPSSRESSDVGSDCQPSTTTTNELTPPRIKIRRGSPSGRTRIPTFADMNSILLRNDDYSSDSDLSQQDFREPRHREAPRMHMNESASSYSPPPSSSTSVSPRDLAYQNIAASNNESSSLSSLSRFYKTDEAPHANLFGGSAFSAFHDSRVRR